MKDKKVFVAGCGGLGCYEVEFLVRLGVEQITVADGDVFSQGNMNRQLYCTPETIGRNKAEIAFERWPENVVAINSFIDAENVSALIEDYDLVIDALDNVDARRILAGACQSLRIPLIHGAIGDTNTQCCVIFPDDGDLLDILYPGKPQKIPTFSYTPAHCASLQIALAAKVLKGEPVDHRTLYLSDLDGMNFESVTL